MSDEDENQRSPTLGYAATQQFRTTHRHSHRSTLRPFNDDIFNTHNPGTARNRLNSTLDRLESLINKAAIENVSQSAKDRMQALANRLNGNDVNKTLGKMAQALEKLTTQQENTPNATTPNRSMVGPKVAKSLEPNGPQLAGDLTVF